MDDFVPTTVSLSPWIDALIVFGAIVAASLLAFVWFAFFHKKKRKRKHRHRHRERRPTNPTLAETGGLPPVRKENEPPPQS